jgi:hypothetical protein
MSSLPEVFTPVNSHPVRMMLDIKGNEVPDDICDCDWCRALRGEKLRSPVEFKVSNKIQPPRSYYPGRCALPCQGCPHIDPRTGACIEPDRLASARYEDLELESFADSSHATASGNCMQCGETCWLSPNGFWECESCGWSSDFGVSEDSEENEESDGK